MPTAILTLLGDIPAKKSLYRRGKKGLFLDTKTKGAIDSLIIQCMMQWKRKPVIHPDVSISFRFRNAAKDSDGAYVTILDCLTKGGVIHDDCVRKFNGTKTILPATIDPDKEEVAVIELRWWNTKGENPE